MTARYSPWGDLAAREHIDVEHVDDLDDDLEAVSEFYEDEDASAARTIAIATRLDRVERRCALAHELAHIDLGHQCIDKGSSPDAQRLHDRNEEQADELAARRLVSDDGLVRALQLHGEAPLDAAADELDVTVEILEARLRGIRHPSERAWLRRAVLQEWGSA